MTPLPGEIRYLVYIEPCRDGSPGSPRVGRLRLEGFTPAGKKGRWRWIDEQGRAIGRGTLSFDADAPPPATPDGAIARFQRFQVRSSFFERDDGADERVRLILAAEALRAKPAG